jgi:outer membrane biosynthesis protein TonB
LRGVLSMLLALCIALPTPPVSAAGAVGELRGTVTVEGRRLEGMGLSVVNVSAGSVHHARTDAEGAFRFALPAGEYVVGSQASAGFVVSRGPSMVSVQVGKVALANLEMAAIEAAAPQDAPVPPPAPVAPAVSAAQTEAPLSPAETQVPEPATSPVGASNIQHEPVGCLVAGEFPMLDAVIQPAASVGRARLYFKSALSEFYYSEMQPLPGVEGGFRGFMPKPTEAASPITYYIESVTTQFGETKTPEYTAIVVSVKEECPENLVVAPFGEPPVGLAFFSAQTGALAVPTGFAAGGLAAGLGTAAILALAGGAVAAAAAVVVVTNPDPSPSPTATPTPTPTPVPTPRPTPTPTPTEEPPPTPPPVSPFS